PTGRPDELGDRPGLQIALPISKQLGHLYLHGNAGFTQSYGIPLGSRHVSLTSPLFAGGFFVRMMPMLNLLVEATMELAQELDGAQTRRRRDVMVSPGVRGGWNLGENQLIVGAAMPVSTSRGESSLAVLGYVSYEIQF